MDRKLKHHQVQPTTVGREVTGEEEGKTSNTDCKEGSTSAESFQHELVNDMYHYSEYNKALQKETSLFTVPTLA